MIDEYPEDHPIRNTPLAELRAEARHRQLQSWKPISHWKIGQSTFNQLGKVWTDHYVFRCGIDSAPNPD